MGVDSAFLSARQCYNLDASARGRLSVDVLARAYEAGKGITTEPACFPPFGCPILIVRWLGGDSCKVFPLLSSLAHFASPFISFAAPLAVRFGFPSTPQSHQTWFASYPGCPAKPTPLQAPSPEANGALRVAMDRLQLRQPELEMLCRHLDEENLGEVSYKDLGRGRLEVEWDGLMFCEKPKEDAILLCPTASTLRPPQLRQFDCLLAQG